VEFFYFIFWVYNELRLEPETSSGLRLWKFDWWLVIFIRLKQHWSPVIDFLLFYFHVTATYLNLFTIEIATAADLCEGEIMLAGETSQSCSWRKVEWHHLLHRISCITKALAITFLCKDVALHCEKQQYMSIDIGRVHYIIIAKSWNGETRRVFRSLFQERWSDCNGIR
jgi:hypothetical protein